MDWQPAEPVKGKPGSPGHRPLEQGTADLAPTPHVARPGDDVRSLASQAVHRVDVGRVVGTVAHGDEHVRSPRGAKPGLHRVERPASERVLVQAHLRKLRLQPLHDGDGGVLVEVVDDQDLERPRLSRLDDAAKCRDHVLALVVDGDDDAQGGRLLAHEREIQMRAAAISSRIQGITSSSTSSSGVVASNPSISRALLTSGTRICTSCS